MQNDLTLELPAIPTYQMRMKAAAVIVAAGSGQRFGSDIPKQFLPLGPWPVWRWSYEAFLRHPSIGEIVVVVSPDRLNGDWPDHIKIIAGGPTRTQSVVNGLRALNTSPAAPVLIHDAARPGIGGEIINRLLEALSGADAAAPALPISDALKRRNETLLTIDRSNLYRIQTPQIFTLGLILNSLSEIGASLVDDLEAIEKTGGNIALISGNERLNKITHPGDLDWMEDLLMRDEVRTGSGFDVHMFEPGNKLTLCGVEIPHTSKLKGHSDADAPWHALTDAILGALALGDIGDHFPPSDPKWKNAPSSIFLKRACELAANAGYRINNVDLTLICEEPKIKPHREAMRRSTARCLDIAIEKVSVKATTTEGLGFTGRSEGLAAQANVTLAARCMTVR